MNTPEIRRRCEHCLGDVAPEQRALSCAAGCGTDVLLCDTCATQASAGHPNGAYTCWFCGLHRSDLEGVQAPVVEPADLDETPDVDDDPLEHIFAADWDSGNEDDGDMGGEA